MDGWKELCCFLIRNERHISHYLRWSNMCFDWTILCYPVENNDLRIAKLHSFMFWHFSVEFFSILKLKIVGNSLTCHRIKVYSLWVFATFIYLWISIKYFQEVLHLRIVLYKNNNIKVHEDKNDPKLLYLYVHISSVSFMS